MLLAVHCQFHNASRMDIYMDSCRHHRHVAILFIKSPLRWRIPHMCRHIPWLVKKLQVRRRLRKAHLILLTKFTAHGPSRTHGRGNDNFLFSVNLSTNQRLLFLSGHVWPLWSQMNRGNNMRLTLQIICVDDSNVLTLRSCSYRHSRRYDLMIYKIVSKMVILWRSQ